MLTEIETAQRLGISIRSLRKMRAHVCQDPLPFFKIGSSVRYSEADLYDWLERRRVFDSHQGARLKSVG